jgi:hypothetical protein
MVGDVKLGRWHQRSTGLRHRQVGMGAGDAPLFIVQRILSFFLSFKPLVLLALRNQFPTAPVITRLKTSDRPLAPCYIQLPACWQEGPYRRCRL